VRRRIALNFINSKFEYLNPKQIQNPNYENSKQRLDIYFKRIVNVTGRPLSGAIRKFRATYDNSICSGASLALVSIPVFRIVVAFAASVSLSGPCVPALSKLISMSELFLISTHIVSLYFFNTGQKESRLHPASLSTCRQNHWFTKRSDHQIDRPENFRTLSRTAQTDRLLRHQYEQAIRLSHKQLCSRCADYRTTLQVPLADRTVFQMDQTTPANQSLFSHIIKRSQDPDMDCCEYLPGRCDHEERTRIKAEFVRNPANSQHYTFSERAYYTSTYEN